jgi:tetratricopeptide (TPR) repeat protein
MGTANFWSIVASMILLVIAGAASPEAGPGARERAASLCALAYEAAYNLDQSQAERLFREAVASAPREPAGYRGLAGLAWLHLVVFERGAATIDDFLGKISRPNVGVEPVQPARATAFRDAVGTAIRLGDARLQREPRDVTAHFEVGAAHALLASYESVIEGRVVGAMRAARRAYKHHEEVLRLDPARKDAGLVIGSYRYVVSTLSPPMRLMAYAAGFGGGREAGLRHVEQAAAYPSDAQVEARFLLMLLYNREKRFDEALRIIRGLERDYPRNRLLVLNRGVTLARAGRHDLADAAFTDGYARFTRDERPKALGEEALWLYKRAASRVALGRLDRASEDLRAALAAGGRDWVRGRSYLELGKIADAGGDRDRARSMYGRARELCRSGRDRPCAEAAQRFASAPFRPPGSLTRRQQESAAGHPAVTRGAVPWR